MSSEVYYRIFLNREEKLTIVEMQDFDEYDYDEKKFYRDDNGERMKWDDEDEAIKFLNDNFKAECIDPEYLLLNNDIFKKMEKDS